MGRTTTVLAVLTVVLLVAAACGDRGDDRSAAGGPSDPCDLLTPAQLDRATGWTLTVDRGTGEGGEVRSTCEWIDAEDTARTVQVRVESGGRAEFDDRRAQAADRLGGGQDVPVVGAAAAFEVPGHGLVVALAGNDVVQVTVAGADTDEGAARSIARTATARLDGR